MAEPLDLSVTQIDGLLRYLSGQATAAETEDVVRWLAMRPEHAQVLAALGQALEMPRPLGTVVPEESSADAAWDGLAKRLSDMDAKDPPPLVLHRVAPAVERPRSVSARSWARAAAVLAAVGVGLGLWRAATWHDVVIGENRNAAPAFREYATRSGERASFTLSDGTQVSLGVASRLRVPHDYGHTIRELTLEGEAYFDVQHDANRRFVVHSRHGIAEDLGTRFDVRDYRGDTAARVIVAEGQVALRAPGAAAGPRHALLTAGQLAYATASGTVTARRNVDVGQYLAWLDGRLVLRDIPLRDALPQLSRWYDLDFQLGDSTLATTGVTAVLTRQPIAGVLDMLALTLGVRVVRQGRTVTLYRP